MKNLKLFALFSLVKIAQENVFKDILERKKAFLDCKNKKLKSQRIVIFPNGLDHDFDQKFETFPCFHFSQDRP